MKVIGAIIGWLFGLLFAIVMFTSVLVIIPVSVFGQEILNRDSTTRLIKAIVEDEESMESFVDGVLESAATSGSVEDPGIRKFLVEVGNKETPEGKAARDVFDSKTVSTNLIYNADAFFDWLEGDDFLTLNLTIGGTPDDHAILVASFLETQMTALPKCSSAQLESLLKDISSDTDFTCNPSVTSTSEYKKMAKTYLSDVKIRKYLREGYPVSVPAEQSERNAILMLQKISGWGIMAAWIVIAISILFMLILFSPKGVKQLMTGLVVAFTGITLSSMGGGALSIVTKQVGMGGVESVAAAFEEVIGKPIATQGTYMIILGAAIFVWGIISIVKKSGSEKDVKKNIIAEDTSTPVQDTKVTATVTPVIPISKDEPTGTNPTTPINNMDANKTTPPVVT